MKAEVGTMRGGRSAKGAEAIEDSEELLKRSKA